MREEIERSLFFFFFSPPFPVFPGSRGVLLGIMGDLVVMATGNRLVFFLFSPLFPFFLV